MFIKKIVKNSKKTGSNYFTYRLCESYRIDDTVRYRNILNIGKLENIRNEDFKLLCDRIEQKVRGINTLEQQIDQTLCLGVRKYQVVAIQKKRNKAGREN
jgi:hypothetical protein